MNTKGGSQPWVSDGLTNLTAMNTVCIRLCMAKILTVRLPVELHQKAEARVLRLGLDRAK